jgi:hypothetical protein
LSSIIKVSFEDTNEIFAKKFVEALVRQVNNFYIQTKTRKTYENLGIIKKQVDSVKFVMDSSLLEMAKFQEMLPNANPLYSRERVPLQKIEISLKTSAAAYQELMTKLEIAKITHQNNIPVVEVIDAPILPLENDKIKTTPLIIFSIIIGGFLSTFFYSFKLIFLSLIKD